LAVGTQHVPGHTGIVIAIQGRLIPGRVFNPGIPNPGIGDALIPGFRDYKNCKLHAEKVKFGAYFCHNFVEFVAYFEMFMCFR